MEEHFVEIDGLRVTTIERTLLDVAGLNGAPDVGALAGTAIRHELTSADRLGGFVDEWGNGCRGARRLAFEAKIRSDSTLRESELEDRAWNLMRRSGLRMPVPQFAVEVDGRSFRLDFAWPQEMVALECDGLGAHGPEKFRADRERLTTLTAAGWRVIVATWWDVVERGDWLMRQISTVLAR